MKRIREGWSIGRLLRLLLGTGAVAQGLAQKENLMLIVGLFIVLSAVLNYGCCGNAGCPVPPKNRTLTKVHDEEMDTST
jgi:hypothetical protein